MVGGSVALPQLSQSREKIMWSIQRRSNPAALSAPAVVQLLGEWNWEQSIANTLPCARGQSVASTPPCAVGLPRVPRACRVAIVHVRAVLPLIWK